MVEGWENLGTKAKGVRDSGEGHEASKEEPPKGEYTGYELVRQIELPGVEKIPRVEIPPWGGKTIGMPPDGDKVPIGDGRGRGGDKIPHLPRRLLSKIEGTKKVAIPLII